MRTPDHDQMSRAPERRVATLATQSRATEVITHGRRRTTKVAVAGALVAAIVVALGVTACTRPQATPRPADTPTPTPSSPASWLVSGVGREDPNRVIPVGYLLNLDEEASGLDDNATPCWRSPAASANWTRQVRNESIQQELHLYADAATATQVFAAIRQDVPACAGFPGSKIIKRDRPAIGDEAVSVTIPKPADGAGEYTGQPLQIILIRTGAGLAMVWGYPASPDIESTARTIARRMCRFTASCQPAAGMPVPLAELRDGADVWAAAFPVQKSGQPGAGAAAAAELGYRASVTSIGCDEGAAEALGNPSPGQKYAAVYFATQVDAQAFAAALPKIRVQVIRVRTHCG